MKFFYKARNQEGELQVGNVEAPNKEAAINRLLSYGLFVLSVEPVKEDSLFNRISNYFQRVKIADLMIFTRQFSTLIASQIPLVDSLKNLARQTTKPVLKEIILEMKSDIEAGFSLSQALANHPKVFSEFYINMIKSAEITGRLSETLDFLADYLEKQTILISKIRNALIYPAFVIGLFIIAAILMVTLVLPQIIPVFKESNVELPFFTKFLINFSDFFTKFWFLILITIGVLIFFLIDYFSTKEGKVLLNEIVLRMPILGKIFKNLYLARFSESMRVLIKGGLTIPQAVEVTSKTIGNHIYQELLYEAGIKIRQGKLLSQVLTEEDYFPPLVSQLIAIGESTGRLEELLLKINNFYSRQVEDIVNNLVELIQPILMVLIGVLIALLFASILLPLYNMVQSF